MGHGSVYINLDTKEWTHGPYSTDQFDDLMDLMMLISDGRWKPSDAIYWFDEEITPETRELEGRIKTNSDLDNYVHVYYDEQTGRILEGDDRLAEELNVAMPRRTHIRPSRPSPMIRSPPRR